MGPSGLLAAALALAAPSVTGQADGRTAPGRPVTAVPAADEAVRDVLREAMRGDHEARPHGVADGVDWSAHPRIGMGAAMPAGWGAMTAWGQIYAARPGNPARNVRVEIRDLGAWLLRKRDRTWIVLQPPGPVEGAAYREDFAGDANVPAVLRPEPDGGASVRLVAGHNFHFWPKSGRVALDPADVAGLVVTYRVRLVLDDPAGPDDRARARIVAGAGGDYWRALDARWDQWKTNGDFAIGKFRLVRSAWRLVAAHTFTASELDGVPAPPIP